MANILLLVHRLPYPPNKGDKVRSYHLLKHLTARHRVYLGTFVDDPDDWRHLPVVSDLCADMHVARLRPWWAKMRGLMGFASGQPLGLHYYRDAGLQAWVCAVLAANSIDAIVVFSSTMAQYAPTGNSGAAVPVLVDFVDLDSAKWSHYAQRHRWPLSWIFAREGRLLLAFERALAARTQRSFFVSSKEAELFLEAAPECREVVEAMGNGVDSDYFLPDPKRQSPFRRDEVPLVFTGAMDYWPNVDAVCWFVADVLPKLSLAFPALRLYVVGRNPAPAVQALAGDRVVVTGTVADVRPYLQHSAVVVAPMRVARGVQNKILEAMAMARPVVAARTCVDAIEGVTSDEIVSAMSAQDYLDALQQLLSDPGRSERIGGAGRSRVLSDFSWSAHLSRIDKHLPVNAAWVGADGSERREG